MPFMDSRFVSNRHMMQMIKGIMGVRLEIDTFSSVTSLPDCPDQVWHADVGHAHSRLMQGEENHSPPQGLIALTPLVDMVKVTGPTEFVMGSHVNIEADFWDSRLEEAGSKTPTPALQLPAKLGSVILFDMRIHHRGRKNKSQRNRAIAYVGYVKEWFYDKVNFKDPQTRGFDSLPLKKLFMRLDTKRYTDILEEYIRHYNVTDLAALQSIGGYKKIELTE